MLRKTALLLATIGLAASLALPAIADAKVYRPSGGAGESRGFCHGATSKIEVQSWVYKDYGGAQDVGAQVLLYNTAAKMWYDGGSQVERTLNPYGVTGSVAKFDRTITVPRVTHAVWVHYWWNTTRGWQSQDEFIGYCF